MKQRPARRKTAELLYFPFGRAERGRYAEEIAEVFSSYLSKNALRLTAPRRKILDYLLRADRHVTQENIHSSLRRHGIGRSTVFRTLRMLEASDILSRVEGPGGPPRFEIHFNRPHHDHLVCVRCGRIREIRWPDLEKIQERACRKIGFEVKWHRHEIFGLCSSCARRLKAP